MKRSLGASERIRQVLGVLVLVGVAAIALGLDTRVLAKLSSGQTAEPRIRSGAARSAASRSMTESQDAVPRKMGELVLPVEGDVAVARRARPVDQQPAADPRAALRGKVVRDRFLDLQLHQLPALDPLCPRVARAICARTGWW